MKEHNMDRAIGDTTTGKLNQEEEYTNIQYVCIHTHTRSTFGISFS